MRNERWTGAARAVLLLMAVAVAGAFAEPAGAQTVQKCVGRDGHVTLTSGACGAGERLAASYAAVPEPAPAPGAAGPDIRHAPRHAGRQASRAPARRAPRAAAPRTRTAPDRCQSARDRRERTLHRVGLKRSFDLLRRLDDEVREACR